MGPAAVEGGAGTPSDCGRPALIPRAAPALAASSSSESEPARGEPSAAARAASAASAAPGAKRSEAEAFGSSVDGRLEATTRRAWLRRTALRTRRSRIGASSTSSVSSTRMASAWSMSDTRADRSGRARMRAWAPEGAAPAVTCGEPSPLRSRCCARKPSSFVALPPRRATVAAPDLLRAAAASDSARSHDTSRRKPPSRTSGAVMRSLDEKAW